MYPVSLGFVSPVIEKETYVPAVKDEEYVLPYEDTINPEPDVVTVHFVVDDVEGVNEQVTDDGYVNPAGKSTAKYPVVEIAFARENVKG